MARHAMSDKSEAVAHPDGTRPDGIGKLRPDADRDGPKGGVTLQARQMLAPLARRAHRLGSRQLPKSAAETPREWP